MSSTTTTAPSAYDKELATLYRLVDGPCYLSRWKGKTILEALCGRSQWGGKMYVDALADMPSKPKSAQYLVNLAVRIRRITNQPTTACAMAEFAQMYNLHEQDEWHEFHMRDMLSRPEPEPPAVHEYGRECPYGPDQGEERADWFEERSAEMVG